ncbi:hypothetical protein MTR67_040730 [Solanum verrucosum]|uniref:C2H2-type domain-containing protein n=1 Tax=Solanum verrucosum TaxID=315347 RepID=A0AAF0ZRZ6_SOLVR|nr:hypothetical protein MTR67_040730 [Solanum verrucosum]
MMKNSSTHEEVELQPKHQENGIGRSYECVFCKRGFNTAQALGGHMNIHRKDRIKITRPSQTNRPYLTYFSGNTSTATKGPFVMNGPDSGSEDNRPQCLNLFGDDWRILQFGENMEKNKGILEDDLDLELRLGHDP